MISEKNFLNVFLIISLWELYVAMKTRFIIQSAQIPYAAFPPIWWCIALNLIRIGHLTLEMYFFENVDGRWWPKDARC